jgi:hypothetical protein
MAPLPKAPTPPRQGMPNQIYPQKETGFLPSGPPTKTTKTVYFYLRQVKQDKISYF